MSAAGKPEDRRGLLKPGLSWPGGPAPKTPPPARPGIALPPETIRRLEAAGAARKDPKLQAQKKAGLGSNSQTQGQYTLEQLRKMAESRGISVEKLVAQMVQQYLKEDGGGEA